MRANCHRGRSHAGPAGARWVGAEVDGVGSASGAAVELEDSGSDVTEAVASIDVLRLNEDRSYDWPHRWQISPFI